MPKDYPQRTPNPAGAMLRRLRERSGISTRELARRMRVASSYVSKVELGQLDLKPEFCTRAARVLGLSGTERSVLGALLDLSRAEYRSVATTASGLRRAQQAVERLERGCSSYRVFQLSLIPGLLQTRDYAQAIFSRLSTGRHTAVAVSGRMARQRILEDPRRSFQFLISDWALAPHWCSERVLAKQLRHLRRLSSRPNVDIRVLSRGFHFPKDVPPLVTGFEVLDETAVVLDTLRGFTTFRHPEEVACYAKAFDRTFVNEGMPHQTLRYGG